MNLRASPESSAGIKRSPAMHETLVLIPGWERSGERALTPKYSGALHVSSW